MQLFCRSKTINDKSPFKMSIKIKLFQRKDKKKLFKTNKQTKKDCKFGKKKKSLNKSKKEIF